MRGGVDRTVGKLMSAHTTARCWNCGQSPFDFHCGTMQKILTMDEEAYELIPNYLPGTGSNQLEQDFSRANFCFGVCSPFS